MVRGLRGRRDGSIGSGWCGHSEDRRVLASRAVWLTHSHQEARGDDSFVGGKSLSVVDSLKSTEFSDRPDILVGGRDGEFL